MSFYILLLIIFYALCRGYVSLQMYYWYGPDAKHDEDDSVLVAKNRRTHLPWRDVSGGMGGDARRS